MTDPRSATREELEAQVLSLQAEVERLRERLDLVQDVGRLCVWERDAVTGAGRWDARLFALFGIEAASESPSFELATTLMHPDDRVPFRALYNESLARLGRHDGHYRVMRQDGTTVYAHSIWDVKPDAEGRPSRVLGVTLDDTPSVRLAEHFDAPSRQLQMATGLVGIALWRIDLRTKRLRANAFGYGILGRDGGQEGLPLARLRDVLHPADQVAEQRATERAVAGADVIDAELRYRRADGGWCTLLTRRVCERDAEGKPIALLGIGLDISDRRAAEAALREAQERVSLATQAAGIGTWEIDIGTRAPRWDDQMYRLRGLEPSDPRPVDRIVDEITPAGDHPMAAEKTIEAAKAGVSYSNEFRVRMPDGSMRWLASRGRVVKSNGDDAPLRMVGVSWDITEQKAGEQALRDKAAAEQESRAKSEFLARMSHELRTPLNAVLGFSELLLGDPQSPLAEPQRARAEHIRRAGSHLLTLIDDVLDLTGIEAGRLNLLDAPLAIDGVLAEAQRWTQASAAAKGVTIELRPSGRWVRGDAKRWQQVFANLLSNAVKYNVAGGRVVVEAIDEGAGEGVLISVRDTGRGLSAAQSRHLFEPFNRLGAERDGIEGTGIGLSIVKMLVERMGGRVTAHSEPGCGSDFRVWLRAATAGADVVDEAGRSGVPLAAADVAMQVLYIEDDPVNTQLVCEVLRLRPAIDLRTEPTGLSGVAAALQRPPQLALIDMQLPDIDGFDVLRRLRAEPRLDATRCIALSANAMPDDVLRARAAGFDDYWTKPIDFKRFLADIDKLASGAC